MFLPFVLLTLALLALWLRRALQSSVIARHGWALLLIAASVAALVSGALAPLGIAWIAGLALATAGFAKTERSPVLQFVLALTIVVLGVGLMSHWLPGFENPRVLSGVRLSPDALPYRLHLNFDKTVLGLLLLAFCHPLISSRSELRTLLIRAAPAAGVTIAALLVLSLTAGYVRFDPKFPREAWLWIWVNLFFTCMAEEAFFRGFIQARLARLWRAAPRGEWFALAIAAVLFGAAHFAGGLAYVVLATVAGTGYGWVYLRTRRIEASILTHFALNAVHFFGFTYPALQR